MERVEERIPAEAGGAFAKSKVLSVKNPASVLVIALILCLVGGVGASLIKTVGNSVTVKQISWETPSGHLLAGQLFIPKNATADTPAPAVVAAHGGSLNSEYPDQYYIELSRRGYVVYSIDMYGHGRSEATEPQYMYNGLYEGVQYLATLPYVNQSGIGITGNSNGAFAVDMAVMLDSAAEKPLITSALYVVNDPTMVEGQAFGAFLQESNKKYFNVFGSRDVGLITAQYDVTFNRVVREDGTVSAPRDYLHQHVVQSFLNFGKDPSGLEERDSHTIYKENIGGREAIRVLYDEPIIHPWSLMDSGVASDSLEFFDKSLPAPEPIAYDNQIWQWKTFFSVIGIIGLFMFLVSFILVMLRTKAFRVLKAEGPVQIREVGLGGKIWLWTGMSVAALFGGISFEIVYWVSAIHKPSFFTQGASFSMGAWALACALFILLILFVNYRTYAKKNGLDLREQGVVLAKGTVWKTVSLGVLATASTYAIVFLVDYFFRTDFHFWTVLWFNTFQADKILESLKYLPFLLVFYITLSIATNVFNYIRIGKREWVNLLINVVFNTLGALLLVAFVYIFFVVTGNTPLDEMGIAVFTPVNAAIIVIAIVPIATIITRLVYKATRNPYLPAIAVSIIVTVMTCTRALTLL
ncbi:hypothetical protein [Sphaerisporangium sp. NPDC051011]|uniref:alpha/beta hydrolase family protein n=1 Tax=Sphaerisporangium sp. NPDC051011 TaxID=3155792 RepID=UPI0033DBCBBF